MTEKTRTLPERHGKRWEDDEIQYMLGRIKQGKWPVQIAAEVKRTTGSIVAQLQNIACDSVRKGMTLEDAATLTSLTVEQIEDTLTKHEIAEKIREERKSKPAEPKQTLLRPFFLNKSDETVLDVVVEIRDLLRQLVQQTRPQKDMTEI
jgi:hypothetical protein